jgi:hypothetical protein
MIACFRAGIRYVEAPVGFDGITIIAHPSVRCVQSRWSNCAPYGGRRLPAL